MKKREMSHRSDEITAYLSETLEPEAKAAFEAHLATCEECQSELAAQKALFDRTDTLLAFKGKRTIDEQVARFEKMVAEERAAEGTREKAAGPAMRRAQRRWAIPAVVAFAASAAAVFVVLGHLGSGPGPGTVAQQGVDAGEEKMVTAPLKPKVDGGMDGGVGPDGR